MTTYWDQLALMEPSDLQLLDSYIKYREKQHLVQFLMALRDQFEPLRGAILHRSPLPSVDGAVRELIAEETRFKVAHGTPASQSVFATPPLLPTPSSHLFQVTGKPKPRVSMDECSFCHQKGHWKHACPKLLQPKGRSSGSPFAKPTFSGSRSSAAFSAPVSENDPSSNMQSMFEQFKSFMVANPNLSSQASAMTTTQFGLSGSSSSGNIHTSWIFDSGCSHHMTPVASLLSNCVSPSSSITIATANGSSMPVHSVGSISCSHLSLSPVFYVPHLSLSLISISQLSDSGFDVVFSSSHCVVQDRVSKRQIGIGRRVGELYILESLHVPLEVSSTALSSFCLNNKSSLFYIWHSRLGHLSSDRLRMLVRSGHLGNFPISDISECRGCKLAKMSALPFNKSSSISSSPFQLVHTDVWGPSPIVTKGGSQYYVAFVDDYSRFTWVYLMTRKSDFYKIYSNFHSMIRTQFSTTIKILRSDLGGEYYLSEFEEYLATHGTIHQSSCSDTPAQNGRAERKHRHLLDTARSLLLSSFVPSVFWGETVLTAAYLLNRMPTPLLSGSSPYERLFGVTPNYSLLRIFGSACFVLLPKRARSKLSSRCVLCVFLGYGINQKGYRCYDPSTKKLYVSRHVTFLEKLPYYTIPSTPVPITKDELVHVDPFPPNVSPDEFVSDLEVSTLPLTSTSNTSPATSSPAPASPAPTSPAPLIVYQRRKALPSSPVSSSTVPPAVSLDPAPSAHRFPKRDRHPPNWYGFGNTCFSLSYQSFLSCLHTYFEPRSYKEACHDPNWIAAMNDELTALANTQTWDLVPLPADKNVVGCKWVYKVKTLSDGSLERYKARLVAQGFSQEYGIDYDETFAPVAKMTTVRTLISVAAAHHWPLFQLDVKNAFLNGHLAEEVYMRPPPGLSHPPGVVCRLRRALYGLKQSPRAWYERFHSVALQLGFRPSHHDCALFVRRTSVGLILLLLYVDDMIITGSDYSTIEEVKHQLFQEFEMKDLGFLRYFLGIEVATSPTGYLLSQTKYARDILSRANLTDEKIVDTPLELHAKFSASDGVPLEDPTLYRELVGCLVYLTVTRPDISYAVHILSQFVSAPRSTHWAALLRTLRYLRGTLLQCLLLSASSDLTLRAYADADWAGDISDRKSTSGLCVFLGDSLISWKSKKQSVVARSTAEAEYRAMAYATSEIVWLRWLLSDMGVSLSDPTPLYCDNQSAVQIAHNSVFHERTKHVEIDCHFVRQHLQAGSITLPFVPSSLQLADFFTKTHTVARFRFLVGKLSMLSALASSV
ncbi:unnamed protein product [Camellia sinensis]